MFTVINRLQCPASYAEHLERAFTHAGTMQEVKGFVDFHFLKNSRESEPLEYIALTNWQSREAYEAWTKSESFQRSHPGGDSPVTATLDTYHVLA